MTNAEYYARRARAETELSKTACDPAIAAVHAELAARYRALAKPKSGRPTLHIASGVNWAG